MLKIAQYVKGVQTACNFPVDVLKNLGLILPQIIVAACPNYGNAYYVLHTL